MAWWVNLPLLNMVCMGSISSMTNLFLLEKGSRVSQHSPWRGGSPGDHCYDVGENNKLGSTYFARKFYHLAFIAT